MREEIQRKERGKGVEREMTVISQNAIRAMNRMKEADEIKTLAILQVRDETFPSLPSTDDNASVASTISTLSPTPSSTPSSTPSPTLTSATFATFKKLKLAPVIKEPCPCCYKAHKLLDCPIYRYQHVEDECTYCHMLGHRRTYKYTVICPKLQR